VLLCFIDNRDRGSFVRSFTERPRDGSFRNGTSVLGRRATVGGCVSACGPASLPRPCAGESIIGSVYQSDGRSARPVLGGLPLRSRIFFPLVVSIPPHALAMVARMRYSESALSFSLSLFLSAPTPYTADRFSPRLATACSASGRVTWRVMLIFRGINSNLLLSLFFSLQGADEDDSASVASVSSSPTADRDYCARQSDESDAAQAVILSLVGRASSVPDKCTPDRGRGS